MTSFSSGFDSDDIVPTSRASFRRVAKSVDATNREADTLRNTLLEHWSVTEGSMELERRLRSLHAADPDGTPLVESQLVTWFSYNEPINGKLVAHDDPVLDGLSGELRTHLANTSVPREELPKDDSRPGNAD